MKEILATLEATALENIELAPWIILAWLVLGGLHLIPVSEDALLILTSILISKSPEHTTYLVAGLYSGIYLSDLLTYAVSYFFGDKLKKIPIMNKLIPNEPGEKTKAFLNKYGLLAHVALRFLPVARNIFMYYSGLKKLRFKTFALNSLIASSITTYCYLNLYTKYGKEMIATIQSNAMSITGVLVVIFLIRQFINKSS